MKITTLIENTPGAEGCAYEHGLSFFIETPRHKVLLDTGKTGAIIGNAERLGVDLTQVDMVFLSHGHYDHTGGLLAFAEINPTAPIYMQEAAAGEFYDHTPEDTHYIGIDPAILDLPQLSLIDGDSCFDDDLDIFTGVKGRRHFAEGNKILAAYVNGVFKQDDFSHEQYLVVSEGKKRVLLSGCAHTGIVNILDKFREEYHRDPDVVISGFHMMRPSFTEADLADIREVAEELAQTSIRFYTGHCTGQIPYETMKTVMGEQLQYLHTGDRLTI